MSKFKPGDMVITINCLDHRLNGKIGTIIKCTDKFPLLEAYGLFSEVEFQSAIPCVMLKNLMQIPTESTKVEFPESRLQLISDGNLELKPDPIALDDHLWLGKCTSKETTSCP